MMANGISYTHFLSTKSYYKVSISSIYSDGGTVIDSLDVNKSPHRYLNHNYVESKVSVNFLINKKFSSQFSTKAGIIADVIGYNLKTDIWKPKSQAFETVVNDRKDLFHGMTLYKAYVQGSYKFSENLTLNPGVHVLFLDLNKTISVEPRIGLNWQANAANKFSFGYGLHSKAQNLYTYNYATLLPNGNYIETNKNIGFTKSHQAVLGWDIKLGENTRLKSEAYYQYMYNVPIETRPTTYSILNSGATWGMWVEDSLVNKGTGRNYGLEFTLERFLTKGFYYLTTLSLYQSKYKGSTGKEYNTAFNGNYVWNFLLGKEFKLSEKYTINLDYKFSLAGGKRFTPVDVARTHKEKELHYDESKAFEDQFAAFFKTDIKVGFRYNGKRTSQEWQFYVENATNHKNPLAQTYSKSKDEITTVYQLGLFPMVNYRIVF